MSNFAGAYTPTSMPCKFQYKNIALIGDGCSQINPFTGAGINNILINAKLLVEAIKKDNLKEYHINWKKRFYKITLYRFLKKKLFGSFSNVAPTKILLFLLVGGQIIKKGKGNTMKRKH